MSSLFDHSRVPIQRTKRTPGDAYYTPQVLADALVSLLPLIPGETVMEPSAGGGAFVRSLIERQGLGCVHAMDIDAGSPGLGMVYAAHSTAGDFLELRTGGGVLGPDWVVGNPPYNQAEAHVRQSIDVTHRHVALLLRLAFLEGAKRIPLWRDHPCRKVWVLSQRPSFTGKGTDSAAYGWFWWDSQHEGPTEMEVFSWR